MHFWPMDCIKRYGYWRVPLRQAHTQTQKTYQCTCSEWTSIWEIHSFVKSTDEKGSPTRPRAAPRSPGQPCARLARLGCSRLHVESVVAGQQGCQAAPDWLAAGSGAPWLARAAFPSPLAPPPPRVMMPFPRAAPAARQAAPSGASPLAKWRHARPAIGRRCPPSPRGVAEPARCWRGAFPSCSGGRGGQRQRGSETLLVEVGGDTGNHMGAARLGRGGLRGCAMGCAARRGGGEGLLLIRLPYSAGKMNAGQPSGSPTARGKKIPGSPARKGARRAVARQRRSSRVVRFARRAWLLLARHALPLAP